jgi:membrane protein implicated in regulation of membrane protease activity
MHLYWLWATVGLLLFVLEIFLGAQFFLFFLGSAALITSGLGALFLLKGRALLLIFSVLALSLLFLWSLFFKNMNHKNTDVNNPLILMKGSFGLVVQSDYAGEMKIKVGHTLWSARSVTHKKISKDVKVKIVGLDGLILLVEPVPEDQTDSKE